MKFPANHDDSAHDDATQVPGFATGVAPVEEDGGAGKDDNQQGKGAQLECDRREQQGNAHIREKEGGCHHDTVDSGTGANHGYHLPGHDDAFVADVLGKRIDGLHGFGIGGQGDVKPHTGEQGGEQCPGYAAGEVVGQELAAAHDLLNHGAKEVERPHVEDKVAEVGMQELVGDHAPDLPLHEAGEPGVCPKNVEDRFFFVGGRECDAQKRIFLHHHSHEEDNDIDDDERCGDTGIAEIHRAQVTGCMELRHRGCRCCSTFGRVGFQTGGDAINFFLREQVLQQTGCFSGALAAQPRHFFHETVENTVCADDAFCIAGSLFGELDGAVLSVFNHTELRQSAHGCRDAGLFDPQHLGNVAHLGAAIFMAQVADGFQVILCAAAQPVGGVAHAFLRRVATHSRCLV